jgi:hypothetical protein
MKKIFLWFFAIPLISFSSSMACAEPLTWTVVLRPADIIVGESLQKRLTRRHWDWKFDEKVGIFEIAIRKSAFPVPAPQCHMDYLILRMPAYHHDNPKQAPMSERRAVYDALLAMQAAGKGTLPARVEALSFVQQGRSGAELTTCNIYFVLPLAKDAGKLLP